MIPVVKGACMIVNGMCGVALFFQIVGYRLAGRFLKNRFIRIFRSAEIVKAHSAQNLKLGVCSTRADGRHPQKSVAVLLFQSGKIRNRILGKGHVSQIIYIKI